MNGCFLPSTSETGQAAGGPELVIMRCQHDRQLLGGTVGVPNDRLVGGSGQKRVSVAYRRSHIARPMASLSVPIAKFSLDLGFEQWAGLAFGYNQHEIARGTAERNIQLGPRPRRISETTLIAGQQHYVVKLQALCLMDGTDSFPR